MNFFKPNLKKRNPNVKEEFGFPCKTEYAKAVRSMKFLCKYHSKEALFKQLRKDVLNNKKNKGIIK